ncbi:hypothetical protein A2415_03475 [candidate division WWE3 bacterium RIFOXYC1_FULL_39_7]|uniref:2-oxoglutarate dehydrogenase n=2 Tax=Katanobacteria TaxID=422282 RepID=A0A1F4X9L2_UNCKA|nr:MAG: hypothetical protein A2415_03475 [candidate division WWE3 bacterium RIFOXYC1_FULL_39_7]OGC78366.1 MAG: hypothetical protein A2619_05060 [candidate division WWE3 bacterium RIFOXYD1_FULL_39_9]
MKKLHTYITPLHFHYLGWSISLAALLGSLYYSEVANLPPCDLCWYQRIAMYPLVIIYMVGILFKDRKLSYYAMPFGFLGLGLSLYQMLLQSGLLSYTESCRFGISCLDTSYKLMGVFTIPMQSFVGFLLIVLSTFGAVILEKAKKDQK